MKFFNSRKLTNILLLIVIAFFCMGAAKEYKRIHNLRVKGKLFGDNGSWCGRETWAYDTTIDTLVIEGIDTTDFFFAVPYRDSVKTPLYSQISANGDTVFVKCASLATKTTDKYNWMVIKK